MFGGQATCGVSDETQALRRLPAVRGPFTPRCGRAALGSFSEGTVPREAAGLGGSVEELSSGSSWAAIVD